MTSQIILITLYLYSMHVKRAPCNFKKTYKKYTCLHVDSDHNLTDGIMDDFNHNYVLMLYTSYTTALSMLSYIQLRRHYAVHLVHHHMFLFIRTRSYRF